MLKKLIALIVLIVAVIYIVNIFTIKLSPKQETVNFIELPENFKVEVFADNLGGSKFSTPGPNPGPRMLMLKDDIVFVSVPKQGEVIAFKTKNNKVDERKIFISNLKNPHGLAYYQDWIYIAEEDRVIRVKDVNKDNVADIETLEELTKLPAGSHWTRTIKIFDNSLFISIGSVCNVCFEKDEKRATIQKCELDGNNCKTFASGLRNSVDFLKYNGKIYASENSRDMLGNNIPPDEINIIEEGKNYGWPLCYGKQIHDSEFDKNIYIRNPCEDTEPSFIDLPAHVAPLGLEVYQGTKFPEEYKNKLFVAYHGSWDSDDPVGYKLVYIDLNTKETKDFATGFLSALTVKGRPVGIINFNNDLLVTDDNAGKIYRIYYE